MNLSITISNVTEARLAQTMLRAYIVTQESAPKEGALSEGAPETPLAELAMSGRAYNCLTEAGITTVEALCRKNANSLLVLPNLGVGTLNDITTALAAKGLTLRG